MPIPVSHSSAIVDINADCNNDLLIVSQTVIDNTEESTSTVKKQLEIWQGVMEDGKKKYCLVENSIYPLDNKLGHFTIADVDRDGLLDIIFPVLNSPKILIAYNKLNLEYDWSKDFCETHPAVDLGKGGYIFDEFTVDKTNINVYNTI